MASRIKQRSFPSPPKRGSTTSTAGRRSSTDLDDDDRENSMGDGVAQEILTGHADKKRQRKQKETKDKLGSIQGRISLALSKYDLGDGQDFKLDRHKSEQEFDVFIIGFNESTNKKTKLLESLYNFFLLYEEDESINTPLPELDLEASYEQAVGSLKSATTSLERLASIHGALIEGYSTKLKDKENKKKTKKLEQALKEAQSELLGLKDTLETTSRNLTEANSKSEGLRITLEMKSSEVEKNKIIIEKLRKQAENLMSADEQQQLKQRSELLSVLEKENTELKLNLANLEFSMRKSSSQSVRDDHQQSESEEAMASMQDKLTQEREKHEEAMKNAKEALEAELADAMNKQSEEHYIEIAELNSKIDDLNSEIDDLNNTVEEKDKMIEDLDARLTEAIRPAKEPMPDPPTEPVVTIEMVVPVPATITTSTVSVDPTEALNKKYSELEEQFKKKRTAVEEEIAKNNEKNQWMVDKLKDELIQAKEGWLNEKGVLESKVEKFRKMVAEMEAAGLEEEHELSEKLREKHIAVTDDIEIESVNGSVHSDREPLSGTGGNNVKNIIEMRPNTGFRNTLTPGPENPVIMQVVTMYDHVTEFKDKLIDILSEIQSLGVIDETETMLMIRSMEQITTLEFNKEHNISNQIEGIQSNIAQVMHSSEKTVHKIFKKLSKEKGKIEKMSWSPAGRPKSSSKSTRRSAVEQCDRATSPVHHFSKPPAQPKAPEPSLQGIRRPTAKYTAMFAHTDLEHNQRSLKQAMLNHKITPKQYEEVVGMMKDYTDIPQKRLQQLARHYISHARMQIMEENIQLNRPVDEDIDDVLSRLDELYLLRRTRLGADMDQLASEREDLAYLLTKQLDRLEHQSGVFLIKPYIAYKAHILNQHQKKSNLLQNRAEIIIGDEKQETTEPDSDQTWSVGASRTTPIHESWAPDVPKILEMDINRITVARNAVSQPIENRPNMTASKTIKSFVVMRSAKSNGSFRPKSNAPSTAEFLSFNSEKSEDMINENLPPLRSGYTSGFVSTSNSRQKLAPIPDPPSNIKVEKASIVT